MTVFPPVWSSVGLPQVLGAQQVHVWAWSLDDQSRGGTSYELTGVLDTHELKRFHRFRFDEDRQRFAIAHATTRRILGSYLYRKPTNVLFRVNAFGKPGLASEGHAPPLYFNLSHSRTVASLALSTETEVGIDVEDVRPVETELAEGHFSAGELASLSLLKGDAWLRGFYRCWTSKEAILKAEGVGLNVPLHSFDVSLLPDQPAKLLSVRSPASFRTPWTLHNLPFPSHDMIGTLAVGNPQAEVRCFWLGDSS